MNYKKACKLLNIKEKHLSKDLKQAYWRLALKFHPDKNPEDDNGEKFKQIKEAYDFITNNNNNINNPKTNENIDYKDLLKQCINFFSPNLNLENIFIDTNFSSIKKDCEFISFEILNNLNKNKAKQVFDFLYKFNHILDLDNDFLQKFKKIILKKMSDDIVIILNPTENNLLNDQIFKLEIEEKEIYIPLWHHELYFSLQNKDLIVKCEPELKENTWIDNQNNIYILEKISIKKIFQNKFHELKIGEKLFKIESKDLKITSKKQIIIFQSKGILKINEKNIYDASLRGDIIVEIYLE